MLYYNENVLITPVHYYMLQCQVSLRRIVVCLETNQTDIYKRHYSKVYIWCDIINTQCTQYTVQSGCKIFPFIVVYFTSKLFTIYIGTFSTKVAELFL